MHIGYVPRERPPFSALNFRSQITHKSVPEHHHFTFFFGGFCRNGDHHFQNFFNFNPFIASHGRLSPNAKRSAAPRVSGRSGDTHFHAQNGSSSFRRYAFSRSKRIKLVPEPHIFTLDRELVPEPLPIFHFAAAHAYQSLGWVPPPPRDHDPQDHSPDPGPHSRRTRGYLYAHSPSPEPSGVMSQNIWGAQSLRGSVATERREGVGGGFPPSHARELFNFSTWKCAIWGIPKKEIFDLTTCTIWVSVSRFDRPGKGYFFKERGNIFMKICTPK